MAILTHKKILLVTALLDILGMGMFLPILPKVIEQFGASGSWVGYSMSFYAIGMFFGGYYFGKLSDTYGRKPFILLTSILNVIGFLSIVFAPNLLFFLLGRIIAGGAGAGSGVVQAAMNDISLPEERTKNMGLIGAMFGIGFLIGPAIGGALSLVSDSLIPIAGTVAALLNCFFIWFFLPKIVAQPKKNPQEITLKRGRTMILLLAFTFAITFGFSSMQSLSTEFYTKFYGFSTQKIAGLLVVVGGVSIIFQGFIFGKIQHLLSEKKFLAFGLIIMTCGFSIMSTGPAEWISWIILPLFPLSMSLLGPIICSLISQESGSEAGKFLGLNQSAMSVAHVIGPIFSGLLYSRGTLLPFFSSACIFGFLFLAHIVYYKLLKNYEHYNLSSSK